MQAHRSHLNLIMWPPDTAHNHIACIHAQQGIHIHKSEHTHKLNHIISSQIINDIILGGSFYNAGQLDARGKKEAVRQNRRTGTKKA